MCAKLKDGKRAPVVAWNTAEGSPIIIPQPHWIVLLLCCLLVHRITTHKLLRQFYKDFP